MFEIKIQCEHCPGSGIYSWFTIAEWRCGVHTARQLISVFERYYRIRDILARIPEQTHATGTAVGQVTNANGIGTRTKHSFYAGVTGVRLAAALRSDSGTMGVIESYLTRDGNVPIATPDVAVMSNRQIGLLTADSAKRPSTMPPPKPPLSPIEERADRITTELLRPSSAPPPPRRRIIDAPQHSGTHAARDPNKSPQNPPGSGKAKREARAKAREAKHG